MGLAEIPRGGPAEDPSIILGARARLGSATLEVLAIRELRRTPDYRKDLPVGLYHARAMETILDELEYLTEVLGELAESTSPSGMELETGTSYLLCVLPAQ